ncbi:HAD-like protein [Gautieria morchelliformis]|nr:HAD-like protein [Gautieria morchelliformis]
MSYLDDIKVLHDPPSFENIVFDIGDVLFTWSPASNLAVTSQNLRRILRSSVWFEYEKGNMSQEECYSQCSALIGVTSHDIATAFQAARDTLSYDHGMISLLRDIKTRGHHRVYAMSNISSPDHQVLKNKVDASIWNLFDGVFTSAAAGERKPHLGFYRHVLSHTEMDPRRTIFIDDKVENVLTASSLGMHGIVFENCTNLSQQLLNLCGDPVARAREYLSANQMRLISYTSENEPIEDNFAQLLILEATGDRRLVDFVQPERQFNFFKYKGQFTTVDYPNDVDTTAIGLTVLKEIDHSLKHGVMDEILGLCNSDGIVQVYFDQSRPRIDPVVCVNALTLFYAHSRGQELSATLDWCCDILQNRAYMHGTLYYAPPEAFLFFLSRLMVVSVHVRRRCQRMLAERLNERIGTEGDALALAMRILAAATVGIRDSIDYQRLRTLQEQDGSWPTGWLYRYGLTGVLIGNKGLTTALALKAIQTFINLATMGFEATT